MPAVTVARTGGAVKKAFAWSYSRLKNYEVCPKRYYETDIAKTVKQDESEALTWGNAVHEAMANRCGEHRMPLPEGMTEYEPWAVRMLGKRGEVFVEQDLAITKHFTACGYFDRGVWFRAKGDFIRIVDDLGILADWKTGKIAPEDSFQLALLAATVFAKFPQLQAVRASYVWLREDAETHETFKRDDMPGMWRAIWPRIERLERAHENTDFPAVQNRTCQAWCGVKTCQYNGRSFR